VTSLDGMRQRRQQVHVVTQARRSLSEDISNRQRKYLLMMGIRAACFIAAVLMFVNHLGWLSAIPAVGAIVIPYFAVVYANGGREPQSVRGFLEYHPNLPATHAPDDDNSASHQAESNGHSADSDTASSD
jgi:hypothetical protein